MKMGSEEKVIKVEDDDDVVILGDLVPKPMKSHIKKRRKRHVELRKSKSVDESLIITQKVKVKKRKHRCSILNVDTNVNKKDVMDSDRVAPVCLRLSCKDVRCQIESNIRKGIAKKRIKVRRNKLRRGFPRDLKRLLSPVSPNSMGNEISKFLDSSAEISLDTSSFGDVKESKLDTLIKRTRERDRINEVARTRYLCTPPHVDTPTSKEIIEDKETCIDYKPPCTSTPKYEENVDNKSMSITNTNTEETKIKDHSFFKEIQAEISPIRSSGDISAVTNLNNEQNIDIPPDGNFKKESNADTYFEGVNNEQKISTSVYGDSMSISHCDNFVNHPNNLFPENANIHQKYSEYSNNALPNTSLAQNFDKMNILSHDNVITKPLSQLSGDKHIQHKFAEHTQNTVSNANLVQNFDKINLSLSNNEDITKQLSLDHSSFPNELVQNKKPECIHTSFSNKNIGQNVEGNGKSILHNNYGICQNLNLDQISVSKNADIQHKHVNYPHNTVSNVNIVQNYDKINLSFSENEITKQLSLVHNSFSNELLHNKSECIHTSFSSKDCNQNVAENGKSILNNNYGFCQNLNLDHIPVSLDTHIQNKNTEYSHNALSSTNLEKKHDKINISLSHNEDITQKLKLDHNTSSHKFIDNKKSEYMSFSNMNCEQNVEENVKSILHNNYGFSQNLNKDHVPFSQEFIQHNTEYLHTPISNKNCEIIENKGKSIPYNKLNVSEAQNQEYFPFSDEQHEKSKYMHTSFFNENCDQHMTRNNEDKDNYIGHNDCILSQYPNQVRSSFPEELIQHKQSSYIYEDVSTLENKRSTALYNNNNRFTNRDDTPFLDERRHSKSEYINTEHEIKPTYHSNNTHYLYPSREQSPFFDERIQYINNEYRHREYQIIEDNILFENHSNRDKINDQVYGDEQIIISDKYAHKRTSANNERNVGDRWVSKSHENNYNNKERSNQNKTYDDNKRSKFIHTDNTYRDSKSHENNYNNKERSNQNKTYDDNKRSKFIHTDNTYRDSKSHENNYNNEERFNRDNAYDDNKKSKFIHTDNTYRDSKSHKNNYTSNNEERSNWNKTYDDNKRSKFIHTDNTYRNSKSYENNYNYEERSNRNKTYDDNKRTKFIHTDNTFMDCDQEFEDRSMSLSYDNNFSKQPSRNHSPFFEDTPQNRYDNDHTVMTDIIYERNIKNMSTSHNDKKFRDKEQRNPSPFIEDIHYIESEKSEYYMKSSRNRYTSYNNNFTKRPTKGHSPFEDIRINHKQKQKKSKIDFVQDTSMSKPFNYSNNNNNKHNQPKDKINQPHWDHRSIFEEIHLRYKKSDYTHKHTVYSNPKYEHKSKRNMPFANNNHGNKPYSHNRNTPNQHKTSKYVHTVSSRKYKKVVHQRETWDD